MRDVLTFLAGLVILVLAAALAVPPLVDWSARRHWVEAAVSRALGQEVRTDGPIDLRLLPTPRLRVQRLRVGGAGREGAALDAMYVRAEIALTPLLAGEVRFLDTRIGRAEIKLPVGTGGGWRMPARLLSEAARRKGWMLEDVRIEQFLLTTADPVTGRTDQHDAETVRIQAGSLLGPFRFEGRSAGRSIEAALGEVAGGKAQLKIGIGGEGARLDIDGQITLAPLPGEVLEPQFAGTAKLAAALPDLPLLAQANVTAVGDRADLADLAIEAGEGAAAIRLAGEGHYQFRRPALALNLSGRRVDLRPLRPVLAAFLASPARRSGVPLPVDLSLTLDSLAVGADEDLSGLSLSLSAEGEGGEVGAFGISGPGRSRLELSGSFRLGEAPGAAGRMVLKAQDGQRLARALEGFGLQGLAGFVEPRPLEASADIALVDPVVSLRSLRVSQGDLRVSGAVRHTAAESGARARLDAQLAVEGLDISALPQAAPLFALARDRDLGLSIDARGVTYGGKKGGHIAGRIATEGAAIAIDTLEVRDLAGAEADLSGRIAADGTGLIAGRLKASRAAPLLDLFGQAWIGGPLSRLVPSVVRDDPVDLRVEVEKAPAGIRTTLKGQLGGAPFDAVTRNADGALASFTIRTDADALIGRAGAQAPPGEPPFMLSAERGRDGRLSASAAGEIGGLAVRTVEPLRLGEKDERLASGEIALEGSDAGPVLSRLGLLAAGPVPLSLKIAYARKDAPGLVATGTVAGTKVAAELSGASPDDLRGTVTLDSLSLPWLASVLALGPVQPAASGTLWPSARFGPRPVLPFGGAVDVKATALDLGRGIRGSDAAFTLSVGGSGLRLSKLDIRLGEARLRGDLGLDRQESLAALSGDAVVEGLSLPGLLAAPFSGGKLTAKLRFGASGESMAGLLANLGGAGEVAIEGLAVEAADPAAPSRLAAHILATDAPIAAQNWQPLLAGELGRGTLAAKAPVAAPGTLVGGVLRLSPLRIEGEGGGWQGTASFDLRNLSLDARGALQSKELPRGWSGAPPTLGLGWAGAPGRIARILDPAPLVSGLATNVLARELDRVDTFDQDAAERRRLEGRREMERQRKADEARRRAREGAGQQPPAPAPQPPANPGG